jgi:sialidase-1
VNECQVVELAGGKLMLNMRSYDKAKKARQVTVSDDGGEHWKDQRMDPALIEPVCQASIRRYAWPGEGREGLVLFSNPASEKTRENMTVRGSLDDCQTWPLQVVLHPGPSAYSDLAVWGQGVIGCLYECGEKKAYERIVLARFGREALGRYALLRP